MKNAWAVSLFFAAWGVVALAAPGEIKIGKWSGYLKIDGASDAVAVTLDTFVVRPDPRADFQILKLLFKYNLGGYGSSEYETELFEDPPYDWDQNILTLDDPKNELIAKVTIEKALKPIMEGKVFIRSSDPPVTGYLRLQYRSDGPSESSATETLTPALSGQYEGKCGALEAALQLETGRSTRPDSPSVGLRHYRVTGAMGTRGKAIVSPRWDLDRAYSEVTYDFFQRKLYLVGSTFTDECRSEGNELTCQMSVHGSCKFTKVNSTPNSRLKIFARQHSLEPTAEQLEPLPKLMPPASADLVAALNGSFHGYLHHEYRDRYQPFVLNVVATTSSENPHIQNDVFISGSAVPYFNGIQGTRTLTFPFDRRIAYFAPPGFVLSSKESDVFLMVQDWRKGFISGVWFSKYFGRVGTFELVKGSKFPPLNSSAKTIAGVSGRFEGPKGKNHWKFTALVPKQPITAHRSQLAFEVEYRLEVGGKLLIVPHSSHASYDIYTGALSWMSTVKTDDEPKLITGFLEESDRVSLFWPNGRLRLGMVEMLDHQMSDYLRVGP